DYLIYDSMCPWGALVGRILGLPTVVSTALLTFKGLDMVRSVGMRTFLPTLIRGVPHIAAFNRLSHGLGREYGIQPLTFIEFFNAPGDLIISYTMPPIQPDADQLDARVHFVGPSIAPRSDGGDFPLERLERKPVIYISLGTIRNDNLAFFRACLQAFADRPYTVVMSVGHKIDAQALDPIPPNFVVRTYNPQLEILQRSDLFITHAGMNSVHEGLYYGVPLLLVPQQQEQTFVALRMQTLGAGLKLDAPTPDAIRAAAERILSDVRYRQNAAQLGETLRSGGGAARAADLVLALVRENEPQRAR
ncbi:MAG TPA: nucleotide disphospho-sugar-binding domain-containing protein, partial [Phototrophicaceae bacterium]|nr:nucleotide disphospho-sugar-binding domain-containing protein [Phototrophicaceae bacterium]